MYKIKIIFITRKSILFIYLPKSTERLITREFIPLLLDCKYECLFGECIEKKGRKKIRKKNMTVSNKNDK